MSKAKQQRFIEIDGSVGEGGGQILRSALALSLCTAKPFRITRIRAGRKKPGLLRQHLTAVRAAATISTAQVDGAQIGSQALSFTPGAVQSGTYQFAVGTAGSTTLVLQSVLYPLLFAAGETRLTLSGGTHNPHAPPLDFLIQTLLPLLERMGARIEIIPERYGFYPAGGGRFTAIITPSKHLQGFELRERGPILAHEGTAIIAGLASHIAERELRRVAERLGWPDDCLQHRSLPAKQGPGNILLLSVQSAQITEVFTGFGRVGVAAEKVADEAITPLQRYFDSKVPVGEYLADQLLLPLALAGSGEFITVTPSQHTLTHIEVIKQFLAIAVSVTELARDTWELRIN